MRTSPIILIAALGAAYAVAIDASAREGRGGSWGGKPGGVHSGAMRGSHGSHSGWHGGRHHGGQHGWHGGRHHGGHGHGWRGHYRYPGYYASGYYPWGWGLGLGVGLTWPWWGWGYDYYPYHAYPYPAGVVIERSNAVDQDASPSSRTRGWRWYCPAVGAYHPDVTECAQPWLRVLPQDGGPPAPPKLPQTPPQSNVPPAHDPPLSNIAPDTLGAVPERTRIAAPRRAPPSQLALAVAASTAP